MISAVSASRITSERAPRDYGPGRKCDCGETLTRYHAGPLCYACEARESRQVPASEPILRLAPAPKPQPQLVRKPPRVTVRVLGITPETVARRTVLLRRLKRLPVGEWLLRPLECSRQMWHQDIAALRNYGCEVEARRTMQGGIRLAATNVKPQ